MAGSSQLAPIADQWRTLAARALEPNVFYEPAFALAAAAVFGRDAGAMLVWSGTEPRRLLGFFPARVEKRRYERQPAGPCRLDASVRAVRRAIGRARGGRADHGRVAGAPRRRCNAAGFAAAALSDGRQSVRRGARGNPQARAAAGRRFRSPRAGSLAPSRERSHYVEQALSKHHHKELRRCWRRLSETGAVLLTAATEPAAVAAAIEDFFALEASGWKGRAGTAAAGSPDLNGFMRAAVGGLAAEGKVSIDCMRIDGRAIATTIVLRSRSCAWFWKIAYDEAFARFSPGVILSAVITDELASDATIVRTNSCATANHPMIDRLWRERLVFCNRLIAVRPQAPFSLARRSGRAALGGHCRRQERS